MCRVALLVVFRCVDVLSVADCSSVCVSCGQWLGLYTNIGTGIRVVLATRATRGLVVKFSGMVDMSIGVVD